MKKIAQKQGADHPLVHDEFDHERAKPTVKRVGMIVAAVALLHCAVLLAADDIAPVAGMDLRLIALNDFHGYITAPDEGLSAPDPADTTKMVRLAAGGAANLAALVRRLQVGHSLNAVVAAGDLVGASPFASALFHDEPTIDLMNAIGLSLSSVGNHEFDHGRDELLRLQNGGCRADGTRGRDTCIGGDFHGAAFHYLAANVADAESGRPLFAPYEIKTFNGADGRRVRIGFIGLVLKNTGAMVLASGVSGLVFRDEVTTANALVPQLQAQGVDAIVLLIHQGGTTSSGFDDQRCPDFSGAILPIVDALDPAIRVVVSGHTHQAYICRRGDRLITSAGSYGRLLTAIDLHFNGPHGTLSSMTADNYPLVNSPDAVKDSLAEPATRTLLDRYEKISDPLGRRVIGHIAASLSRVPNDAGESVLGDLVADSMLDAAHREDSAVIAFTNSGGLRQDLIPTDADGAITYAQLFAALPFGNSLVAMDLSGAQLRTLLDQQRGDARPKPLQVSRGFSYAWSSRGHVDANSMRLDGESIDLAKTYRIVVNQYLAQGGDGFRVLQKGLDRREFGSDLDAAASYFAAHAMVTPGPQDRVRCSRCLESPRGAH